MKEIKTELIWKSCEDNPPTKTDEYIILTKDRRYGELELFFATYDTELNEMSGLKNLKIDIMIHKRIKTIGLGRTQK